MANDVWTIKAALDWCQGYLERKGDEHPRLSAEWLLSEATGKTRIQLYMNFDEPLSMDERDLLRGYVTRRGKGEPLQYITGEVGFRHIAVKVRPGVLIPRPETEVLVSEALALLPPLKKRCATDSLSEEQLAAVLASAQESHGGKMDVSADDVADGLVLSAKESMVASAEAAATGIVAEQNACAVQDASREGCPAFLVADICTGSGCIACSVAYERPDVRVVATDIEPRAVALAAENAAAVGVADRVEILEGDLGTCVDAALMGSFDLIVSNPPYVPTGVMEEIPAEVADYEPHLALDGGTDGLDIMRRLLPWCAKALKPGGACAFELHEGHMDQAASLARDFGFEDVVIKHDLAQRPRILIARLSDCARA